MKMFASIRVGVAAVWVVAAAYGQGLPPTAPTNPGLQAAPSEPQSKQSAQPAQVQLHSGMLTVAADNSSLNQILREISRVTGMKITGGVTDERVYGSYGPADVSTVLSSLIRGTGSNMMIVMDANQAPQELVLTPRAGGPTPPNPNAGREREMEDLPPQRQPRFQRPDGVGNPLPTQFQTQPQQPIQQQPQQQAAPPVPPPVVPSSDTTTQESPNGVKTPQQIYDQLMKMQQQQQQQQKPPQ